MGGKITTGWELFIYIFSLIFHHTPPKQMLWIFLLAMKRLRLRRSLGQVSDKSRMQGQSSPSRALPPPAGKFQLAHCLWLQTREGGGLGEQGEDWNL